MNEAVMWMAVKWIPETNTLYIPKNIHTYDYIPTWRSEESDKLIRDFIKNYVF